MTSGFELICHDTYAGWSGFAVDLSDHDSDGLPDSQGGADFLNDGVVPGSGAVRFTREKSRLHLHAAVGLGWSILEGNWGAGISPGVGPGGDQAAPDVTGGPGNLGKVIYPKSLSVAEPGAELVPWSADKAAIDQRKYDFIVDRSAQVWWPNLDGGPGYRGRWGPRVSVDPFDRRAGMRFPEFWRMFFVAYAKEIAALGL